ncbi:class I SAM-dependent methyltransferase [Micromonospora sp. NPDC049230]|uniref:class I SAM-dependent methyltransferase n=1 Tax=Micromonospora sp. NPDC049230 TaxID=3155502 RepID=UPI00340CEDB9
MAGFVPHLASLEETLCRVAGAVRGRAPGRVLDLGGGPGLLAERMARQWTGAAITLMDIDPVLLALARGALADQVRSLEGDLSTRGWVARTGGGYDLVTVVMTLHYLPPAQVRAFYDDARRCLAPGGLLVVADLMPDEGLPSLMSALDPAPGEAAAELAWAQWWNDIGEVEELRPLLAQRAAIFENRPPAEFTAPGSWHANVARAAGFGEAGILWRCGRHAALTAVA